MRIIRCSHLAAISLILPLASLPAQEKQRYASLQEAIQSNAVLAGRQGPRNVNWIEGGARFSYLVVDQATGVETIHAMDPATDRDTVLFGTERLVLPGTATPFSYDGFEWAHDSRHLLFQTNFRQLYRRSGISDYYVYSLSDHSLQLAARDARTAELSPNGAMIGVERGGNMYVENLATPSHVEQQLTRDGTEHLFNGHFDWVYEEEFGMAQAWNWSPDSRHIAYWQIDERAEPTIQLTDYAGLHPEWDQIRIPQPGDSNPTARVGVVNVATGKTVWLDPKVSGEFYIPRIYWTSRPDTLAMLVLNRPQNEVKLFFFDVTTGGSRQVFAQSSNTWVDVYDFYAGVNDLMSFPEGSHEFFWLTDRDGYQQVYRYDYSGRLVNQVTTGNFSVTRVEGADAATQTMYYTSTEPTPLQRQLYAIRFDGSGKRRITTTTGTHSIDMAPNTRYFIDRWSSTRHPLQVDLWTTASGAIKTLEGNPQTAAWLQTHAYATPELFTFTTSDGVKIDAGMIKPIPFDSTKKYPVLLAVYGGPGSQDVYDHFTQRWGDVPSWGYLQWLAQQGYLIVGVNNRGTNNYGRDFMKVVYQNLGKWESHDFAEAARYVARLPYVDASRVGITGTSYGGYTTVYTMEMYPDVFSMGIANSAVADWRLYDTIYTERYMNVLGANLKGYDESSCVVNAPKLKGHLLLIHAMMDDNVHPQNTMQMLTAFTEAHRDVDLRIYPPGHHGSAYDAASSLLIQQAMNEYLERYLKADDISKRR